MDRNDLFDFVEDYIQTRAKEHIESKYTFDQEEIPADIKELAELYVISELKEDLVEYLGSFED